MYKRGQAAFKNLLDGDLATQCYLTGCFENFLPLLLAGTLWNWFLWRWMSSRAEPFYFFAALLLRIVLSKASTNIDFNSLRVRPKKLNLVYTFVCCRRSHDIIWKFPTWALLTPRLAQVAFNSPNLWDRCYNVYKFGVMNQHASTPQPFSVFKHPHDDDDFESAMKSQSQVSLAHTGPKIDFS